LRTILALLGQRLTPASGDPGVQALLHNSETHFVGGPGDRLSRKIALGVATRALRLSHNHVYLGTVTLEGERLSPQT